MLLLLQAVIAKGAFAARLAVLYPAVREPYRQLFDTIVDGIRESYDGEVLPYELDRDPQGDKTAAWLRQHQVDALVALGSRGAAELAELPGDMPAVVGAVLSEPAGAPRPGISLIPSPAQLFAQLKRLQPGVSTIHVITSDESDSWIIARAAAAAKAQQLALDVSTVNGVMAMAQQYRATLGQMQPGRDALWVAADGKLLDNALMEQLLETAWQRQLLIFSSSLVDVRRGALFTLYPDNRAMGRDLAALVMQLQRNARIKAELVPVAALHSAINLRTADHLSLNINAEARRQFSLMFPQAAY